ncbi:YusW family protein [Lederbergia lenta]|uniref:Putative lipoprotein n=1 Tax=Lederbergia lenta TaxID=1467 RepID=A0A2X4WYJ3_LEDLE|nr:YusW family protein [Lederbergia lenta]MEC2326128.1 YusW family protein [Lederbergia lenta]SQI63502.1 putative lipoprotein [Lederbergia lenta]
MKRLLVLSVTSILSLTVAACGTQSEQVDDSNFTQNNGVVNSQDDKNNHTIDQDKTALNNGNVENEEGNTSMPAGYMEQKWADIDYTDFELEVDYGKNKEYEAEIEINKSNNSMKADLEDELNGMDMNGEEAFNEIYPKVKKLTIDQHTAKDDAINQTLESFNLEPNYNKFELEITFKDSTKIEYEDKK